jgi:hypothetical protein
MADVSTTAAAPLSVTQIVILAYRKAGLLNVYEELDETRAAAGRLELEALCLTLQTEGIVSREITFENLTLIAGTSLYSLSSDVLYPVGSGMYIAPGELVDAATSEIRVRQIDIETWQEYSSKDATGTPTMYYTDRSIDPIQIRLLPIPDAAGTIRFQLHRIKRSSLDGNARPDLEAYAANLIVFGLAAQLGHSFSVPTGKVAFLSQEYEKYLQKYKAHARSHVGKQLRLVHRTPWSN